MFQVAGAERRGTTAAEAAILHTLILGIAGEMR